MRATAVTRRSSAMTQVQTDIALAVLTLPELVENLKKQMAYVARLEAAVTFYAAHATWDNDGVARHAATFEEDRGETARAALLRHVNLLIIALLPLTALAVR